MFRSRHDILELPAVPRERDKLKAIIGTARHQRRKSNLMRFAAYNMIVWAIILLLMLSRPAPSHGVVLARNGNKVLFFPVVVTRSISTIQGDDQ